jgi:hypothetical protein
MSANLPWVEMSSCSQVDGQRLLIYVEGSGTAVFVLTESQAMAALHLEYTPLNMAASLKIMTVSKSLFFPSF